MLIAAFGFVALLALAPPDTLGRGQLQHVFAASQPSRIIHNVDVIAQSTSSGSLSAGGLSTEHLCSGPPA